MVGCVREKKKHLFNIYMCVVRNRRKVQMKLRVIAYTCAIESASLMWNKSSETRDQPNEVGCGNVKERKTRQWTHSQGGFLSTPIRNGFLKPNDVTPVLHMSQPCAFLHPFDYYLSSNVGRWRNSCSLWTPTAPKDVFLQIKIEITRKHFFFTSSIAFPWFFFFASVQFVCFSFGSECVDWVCQCIQHWRDISWYQGLFTICHLSYQPRMCRKLVVKDSY